MKRTEATIATKVATSIEAHLTGAVATISQKNQGVQAAPVIGQGIGHLIFDFISFSVFKAKAFSFCLFFYPARMAAGWNRATGTNRNAGWSRADLSRI